MRVLVVVVDDETFETDTAVGDEACTDARGSKQIRLPEGTKGDCPRNEADSAARDEGGRSQIRRKQIRLPRGTKERRNEETKKRRSKGTKKQRKGRFKLKTRKVQKLRNERWTFWPLVIGPKFCSGFLSKFGLSVIGQKSSFAGKNGFCSIFVENWTKS